MRGLCSENSRKRDFRPKRMSPTRIALLTCHGQICLVYLLHNIWKLALCARNNAKTTEAVVYTWQAWARDTRDTPCLSFLAFCPFLIRVWYLNHFSISCHILFICVSLMIHRCTRVTGYLCSSTHFSGHSNWQDYLWLQLECLSLTLRLLWITQISFMWRH